MDHDAYVPWDDVLGGEGVVLGEREGPRAQRCWVALKILRKKHLGATPKMVGFPNKHGFMGFPTKNHHFGVEIGGTTI